MGDAINLNIYDLKLTPLKQINDERGGVFHYLRSGIDGFKGFGEAYFSKINPSVVKGWKFHKKVHQYFCVPFGTVKIVVFDDRDGSPTKGMIDEIILDDDQNYRLLSMPPQLWYSFKCESASFSLLANIIDHMHEPDESVTLSIETKNIPYDWK